MDGLVLVEALDLDYMVDIVVGLAVQTVSGIGPLGSPRATHISALLLRLVHLTWSPSLRSSWIRRACRCHFRRQLRQDSSASIGIRLG